MTLPTATHPIISLVRTHQQRAYAMAIRMLKNPAEAEDAVQEAYLKAYSSYNSFRGDAHITTWFFRIVYTTCLNILKQNRRHKEILDIDIDTEEIPQQYELLEAIDDERVLTLIRKVMDEMPAVQAVVVQLFFVQQCSYQEIVTITGSPLGTVKTRINRGRRMLQEAIRKQFPELIPEYLL